MRTLFITALLLSAGALPTMAMAQQTCQERSSKRVVGTVAGAGIGGVLGSIIAGSGDKTLGTVLGAVGGGVLGNQVTKDNSNCAKAYGFYDNGGTWHASDGQSNAQTGYYDRDSNWVEGAPRGYYDNQNRWVAASGNTQVGYRDGNGRWVPASANDYDGNRNRVGAVSGYWQNGRWIAGETVGTYDANGRWMAGQTNGRRDANGNWVADAQPGYYDRNGRWQRGTARGAYDARGVWVAAGNGNGNYGNDNYGNGNYGNSDNASYRGNGDRDIQSRLSRIEQRIERGAQDGSLNRNQTQRAEAELDSIRRYDRSLRNRNGGISARNEALVQGRLDRLSDGLRNVRGNG